MKEHLIEEEKCIKIMYQPSVGPRGLKKYCFFHFYFQVNKNMEFYISFFFTFLPWWVEVPGGWSLSLFGWPEADNMNKNSTSYNISGVVVLFSFVGFTFYDLDLSKCALLYSIGIVACCGLGSPTITSPLI